MAGGVGTRGSIGAGGTIVPPAVEDVPVPAAGVAVIATAPNINIPAKCWPAKCWKVALVLPVGDGDLARIDAETRVIAVAMPNVMAKPPPKGTGATF